MQPSHMPKREVVVLVTALFFLFLAGFFGARITGQITSYSARGGDVAHLNVTRACPLWIGFFGNLTGAGLDGKTSLDVQGCFNVNRQNLGLLRCFDTELYATTATAHLTTSDDPALPSAEYMNSLSAASVAAFDNFFNLTNISAGLAPIKGPAVFNTTATFEVGDGELTLFAQMLEPKISNYTMGILSDPDGNIILVFRIANGTAFNVEQVDYQMMLPTPLVGNRTYYLFQDRTDDCPFVIPAAPVAGTGVVKAKKSRGIVALPPRCGDRICQAGGIENCTSCPIDCGACPMPEMPMPVVYEKYVVTEDCAYARVLLDEAEGLLAERDECANLLNILFSARYAIEKKDCLNSILLARSIPPACEKMAPKEPVREKPAFSISIQIAFMIVISVLLLRFVLQGKRY